MRNVVAGLLVAGALAGCGGAVVKECVNGCAKGQRCDTSTGICVLDVPPTVTVESIPNPLTTAKLTLRGTTADDVGVTGGEASFEGQSPVPFTVTGNSFTVEIPVPMLDSKETAVIVKVHDTGMQSGEARLSTVVDRVGPTVALADPTRVVGGAIVRIDGTSEDGSGQVSQVQADFGSGAVTATVGADGAWTVQLTPPAGRDAEDTPLTITAKDKYGNESSTELAVKVDTKGPTFTLTAPTDTVGGASASVSGTVADTSGAPSAVTVRFQGLAQDVTATDGGFTATVTLPQGLDDESRPVTFTAVDRFGNAGSGDFNLTIDTRGPTLTLTGPMVIGRSGELTGTAVDSALPVSDVTVSIQGGSGPTPVDSLVNDIWRLAVAFPAGIDGEVRAVTLSGRDARGNVGTGMGSITVDTVAPVGSITSPAANARLAGAMATFSGTVTDTTSVQTVELDFGDGQGFRAATVTGNTWSVSVPLSPTENEVSHLVTARFTDGVGNSATVTRTVTVDNVAPTVSVTTPADGTVVGGSATTLSVTVSAEDPGTVGEVSVVLGTSSPVTATRQGATNDWTATVTVPAALDFVTVPLRATATDAAGNMASATVNVIVDNVAPVLTITAPTANQVFNISHFTASGNVTISWTVTDGDPQARVNTVGGLPVGAGTSTTWPTVPTDNYVPYSVAVVAGDRMGNSVTRNATFIVDRVPPTVTIWPANNARNVHPRELRFTFSEEMSGTPADPQVITPATSAPAGAWQGNSRITFVRSGLEPYTVFTASVASGVTDRAGNPVANSTVRFHTSARVPPNGTIVAANVWSYDVASDPDGVPMVLTMTQVSSTSYNVETWSMNGATGTFSPWSFQLTNRYSIQGAQAYAWRTVNPDLTAAPTRGVWVSSKEQSCFPSPPYTCFLLGRNDRAYVAAGQPLVSEMGDGLIPSPPLASADGTGTVGLLNGSTYLRDPNVSHNLDLTPARVAPGSARWNVASAPALVPPANTSTSISVSSYKCTRKFPFWNCFPIVWQVVSNATTTASWVRLPNGTPESISMATAEDGCTLMSYPSVASGRQVANIIDNNSREPCTGCLYVINVTTTSAPTNDFVVGKGAGNTLLGVGTSSGGAQLYQTTDCGTTWTPVGAPVAGAQEFKPVLLGVQPGFFYVDSGRTLRLHVP
jgi:hypothetical protein